MIFKKIINYLYKKKKSNPLNNKYIEITNNKNLND